MFVGDLGGGCIVVLDGRSWCLLVIWLDGVLFLSVYGTFYAISSLSSVAHEVFLF